MAGGVEHREARDLIALLQCSCDRMGLGRGEHAPAGTDHPAALNRHDVIGAAPQRYVESLTDGVTRAVVVEMGVGQGMGRDRAIGNLLQDAPMVKGHAGID